MAKCRFDHNAEAVARYSFDEGCVCYPDDKEQDLCAQHAADARPICCMVRIFNYDPTWPWDKTRGL